MTHFKPFFLLVAMPIAALTPGVADPHVTQANIDKTICIHGYTTAVRNVTTAMKKEVCKLYEKKDKCPKGYEIDHLVSLELGGSNDIRNLWPEPYLPTPGAREKDVVETRLHKQICDHKISLSAAQHIIVTDWYAYYREIKRLK